MKNLFDKVSFAASKHTTRTYSTSFSLGIYCLHRSIHRAIYNIYGFVRFADEIVDSFHDFDKATLLKEFREDTYKAIERGISLNPILNSFQDVVNRYAIDRELIDCFLDSMEMDLDQQTHSSDSYKTYILGSAEVVGLMCLKVFTNGDEAMYRKLKPGAMKLGSAFQKINFLRDIKEDFKTLGRAYFPGVDITALTDADKALIEQEIEQDFKAALEGIRQLPRTSRLGVYVAYMYYYALFSKIKGVPSYRIMIERIRIPNYQKLGLLARSYLMHSLRML
ncbi:MAG TPA: phytoene/squalene synthase family protein [Bacteroidia bacterium]|nr:phytoene/squalene synthase family protein [Bacteroidia bacterium]